MQYTPGLTLENYTIFETNCINMLLDNEENTDRFNPKRLNRIYSIVTIIGLSYGCFLFASYFLISKEINNPFLPRNTAAYIFGAQAFKGMLLLAGMTLSQIARLFHLWTGIILLVIAILMTTYSDWIFLSL